MLGPLQFFGEVKSVNRVLLGLVALLLATYGAWAQQSTVDDYFAAFDRARETLLREYHKYPNPTKEELMRLRLRPTMHVGGSGHRFMTGSGRTSPKWTA